MTGPLVPVAMLNLIRAVLGIHHHRFNLSVKRSSGTPRLGPGLQGNLVAKIEAEQPSQLASSSVGAVSFGPFRLLPAQRLLLQAGGEEG